MVMRPPPEFKRCGEELIRDQIRQVWSAAAAVSIPRVGADPLRQARRKNRALRSDGASLTSTN
jgi:hypothetical protein